MKKGVELENSLPWKAPNICFSSPYPFMMFSPLHSDSWGWLQLESHVEVDFPVNHPGGFQGFGLIFHWKEPNPAEAGEDQ